MQNNYPSEVSSAEARPLIQNYYFSIRLRWGLPACPAEKLLVEPLSG